MGIELALAVMGGVLSLMGITANGIIAVALWTLNKNTRGAEITAKYSDSVAKLQDGYQAMIEQTTKLIDTVNKRDEIVDAMRDERMNLRRELDETKRELKRVERNLTDLQAANKAQEHQIRDLVRDNIERGQRITELEAALAETQKENSRLWKVNLAQAKEIEAIGSEHRTTKEIPTHAEMKRREEAVGALTSAGVKGEVDKAVESGEDSTDKTAGDKE